MNSEHLDQIMQDPKAHFSGAWDVVRSSELSRHAKFLILENWKQDAERLAESANENMGGGERNHLQEVSNALLQLKSDTIENV